MKLRVVVAEAWRSLTASLSTTVASAVTVLIGMFLVGLLIGLGTWARSWADSAKHKLVIDVFLCTPASCNNGEVTPQQRDNVRVLLQSDSRIASFEWISKEDAAAIMKKRAPEMMKNIPANPLPESFKVKPKRGEDVVAIADSLEPLPAGVEKVSFGEKTAKRIRKTLSLAQAMVSRPTSI